jgi:hypothetical protein
MGAILKALEEEQLEGNLRSREAATHWLLERFPHVLTD